jgi:pSer/pThr/pTyr-binding forkhead associated (FHA) protein
MWKLTIEDDEGKQTSLPLAHDDYGVGRGEDNAVRLTDRNISRKHARLLRNGQGWVVRDLESYNGTYVNGARVAGEQLVRSGDVVQLGDYRLELADEAIAATPTVPVGAPAMAAPAMMPGVPGASHQRPNRLVMVVGPTPGAEFPLDRDYFTIGRAEEATISINHSSVSRLHAELMSLGGGRYEVVDKQSANGIRINGVDLKRGILEAGDALELGDVRLRFVGAGKLFRADQSQQLPAVIGPFESVAPAVRAATPQRTGSGSVAKIVGFGAAAGVIAVAAVLLALRPTAAPQASAAPEAAATTDAAAGALLGDAKALFDTRDYEGAHARALQIPESSHYREDPIFKKIEATWADTLFSTVSAETDPSEQRKILNRIASTPSVDAERRKKALEMIEAIRAAAPEPKEPVPVAAVAALPASPAGTAPAVAPTPAEPDPAAAPAATAAAPAASTAAGTAKAPTPVPSVPTQGPPDEAAMRRAIEGKVWAGKGTVEEIRLLRAICSHQGDRACRDRATAMLQQKESGG